jgi:4-alpha-glucanotransferase
MDGSLIQTWNQPLNSLKPKSIIVPFTVIKKCSWIGPIKRFQSKGHAPEYEKFWAEQASWVDDFALFKALKLEFSGKMWSDWPPDLRDRQAEALQAAQRKLSPLCRDGKRFS